MLDLVGIAVTVGGISWVVSERTYRQNGTVLAEGHPDAGSLAKGVLLGLLAAFGQASGLVLAKHAMLTSGEVITPMDFWPYFA